MGLVFAFETMPKQVRVYMYIYTHTYMYAHIDKHTHTYAHTHTYTLTHVCKYLATGNLLLFKFVLFLKMRFPSTFKDSGKPIVNIIARKRHPRGLRCSSV